MDNLECKQSKESSVPCSVMVNFRFDILLNENSNNASSVRNQHEQSVILLPVIPFGLRSPGRGRELTQKT